MAESALHREVLRKTLETSDLTFREFAELALYHPGLGYYGRAASPIGKAADYVTAPLLSPVFSFALSNLVREFVDRQGEELCSIVDIGCGDGSLIRALSREVGRPNARFFGVDRALSRVVREASDEWVVASKLAEVPKHAAQFVVTNELYDAFPFARLVQRGERLHELTVCERDGELDWSERGAPAEYAQYFAERGILLTDGQFADVSLEWETTHAEILRFAQRGLVVTMDYGYPNDKLFHPRARRFGTAAAYSGQRVSRDLLANPGEQDLTAHVNFGDLERAGASVGAETLFFDRMARFLLTLGITEHELFRPVHEIAISDAEEGFALLQAREDARRLVLPDGIGEEMRVLVQARGTDRQGWSFQKPLY